MIAIEKKDEFHSRLAKVKMYNINSFISYLLAKGGLTREETDYLFVLYYKDLGKGIKKEDSIYRTILILAYDRFVSYTLTKLNIYDEDCYSVGRMGLIKAIDKYKLERDYAFMTFANVCIRNEVFMLARAEKQVFYKTKVSSIDSLVNNEDQEFSMLELLKSDEDIQKEYMQKDQYEYLLKQFKYLTPVEQYCIFAYTGLMGKRINQVEMGLALELSQAYISRIIKWACKKLKLLVKENLTAEEREEKENLTLCYYPVLTKEEYSNFAELKKKGLLAKAIRLKDKNNIKQTSTETYITRMIDNNKSEGNIKRVEENKNQANDQNEKICSELLTLKNCYLTKLKFLSPIEQVCVIFRYGLYSKQLWTCIEVASRIGVSNKKLEPIYYKALSKMRLLMKNFDEMTEEEKEKYPDLTDEIHPLVTKEQLYQRNIKKNNFLCN